MATNSKTPAIILITLAVLFLYGVIQIFMLRFESGDVYAAYSSLRKDPLGTAVFYEALENIKDVSISRNVHPLADISGDTAGVFLYLGADVREPDFYDEQTITLLEQMVTAGTRLVIAFYPQNRAAQPQSSSDEEGPPAESEEKKENPATSQPDKAEDDMAAPAEKLMPDAEADDHKSITEEWGFGFSHLKQAEGLRYANAQKQWASSLPDVSWHTSLYFTDLTQAWRVIYACADQPVIIEKSLGKGSIVLAADAYFLSNEGVFKERPSGLLAWIIGGNSPIVFNETHLGIAKNTGVIDLVKKYHFYWIILAGLIMAGLFIWKNAVTLVPPGDKDNAMPLASLSIPRDAKEGIVGLLRQNVPTRDMLPLCVKEWENTVIANGRVSTDTAETLKEIRLLVKAEAAGPGKRKNPVTIYRKISQLVSKRTIL